VDVGGGRQLSRLDDPWRADARAHAYVAARIGWRRLGLMASSTRDGSTTVGLRSVFCGLRVPVPQHPTARRRSPA
jgi:hypothetical protein